MLGRDPTPPRRGFCMLMCHICFLPWLPVLSPAAPTTQSRALEDAAPFLSELTCAGRLRQNDTHHYDILPVFFAVVLALLRELEDILNNAWAENVDVNQWLCYDEQMVKTVATYAKKVSHYNPMKPISQGETHRGLNLASLEGSGVLLLL